MQHLNPRLEKYTSTEKKCGLVGFADFNFFATSLLDESFSDRLSKFDKIYCDGFWLFKLLKFKGYAVEYKTGPDFLVSLINGEKKFVVLSKYTQSQIFNLNYFRDFSNFSFYHVPFFDDVDSFDYLQISKDIFQSENILISMGCPKQEKFAANLKTYIKSDCNIYTIGAALDFLIFPKVRAPQILRRFKLEFIWRLFTEYKKQKFKWKKLLIILPWIIKR
jgi:exopolysaccharide biosynthesis WecB/TagA/CpsF family protein